jgi:hypothetical protein
MPVRHVEGEGKLALASDVFVNDYLLVMDNDEDAWRGIKDTARQSVDINEFVNTLREEWDEYVGQVAGLAEREWGNDAPATLLIRQIMGGWGDSEWFAIARHYYPKETE